MARIGVIALQGDVSEHVLAMQKALQGKGEVIEIRKAGLIAGCSGLFCRVERAPPSAASWRTPG